MNSIRCIETSNNGSSLCDADSGESKVGRVRTSDCSRRASYLTNNSLKKYFLVMLKCVL